jgi:putative ABC transport system ATP-binding protein
MAILSGLERASGGEVTVAGIAFGTLDEDGLARMRRGRIGIVLQAFHLLPTMTALENVAVPLELAGAADAFAVARAELEAVGLGHRIRHYPVQLSGGEQQRVAIARAIVKRPDVLLCDEPTGALDYQTGKLVLEVIARINAELGTTAIVITHNAAIAGMSDRVVTLGDGRILRVEANAHKLQPSELAW